MTHRARELVEKLREEARTIQSVSSIMVDPRATLLCKAADFIEQSLTPPEGDTVSLREALQECQDKLWVIHFGLKDAAEREAAINACNMATAALQSRQSPTISDTAGIENALWEYLALLGRRLPDGGIAVHSVVHVPSLARAVIAALQSRVSPQAGMREALVRAYEQGALDVHEAWVEGLGEENAPSRDPDFAEAAYDYADAALSTAPIPMSEDAKGTCEYCGWAPDCGRIGCRVCDHGYYG